MLPTVFTTLYKYKQKNMILAIADKLKIDLSKCTPVHELTKKKASQVIDDLEKKLKDFEEGELLSELE